MRMDERARDLLRRLANSEPYYKRQRRDNAGTIGDGRSGPGPIRTGDYRGRGGFGARGMRGGRGGVRGGRGAFTNTAQLPPGPQDILPPDDQSITSLFLTGVENDLPEHALRTFFSPFGNLRSVVCSHRSHCAFINFSTRAGAEAAAESCQGKVVIAGCPLRIQWGRPRPIGIWNEMKELILVRKAGLLLLRLQMSLPVVKPELVKVVKIAI